MDLSLKRAVQADSLLFFRLLYLLVNHFKFASCSKRQWGAIGHLYPFLFFYSLLWHLQAQRGVHFLHMESRTLGVRLARSLGRLFVKK